MAERNSALLVATIVSIFLAAATGGLWFALMLEHDGAEVAWLAERELTEKVAKEIKTTQDLVENGNNALQKVLDDTRDIKQTISDDKNRETNAKISAQGAIKQVQPVTDEIYSAMDRGFKDIEDERRMMQTAAEQFESKKNALLREIERVKLELKRKKADHEGDISTLQSEIARVKTDLDEVNEKLRILRNRRQLADVLEEDGKIIQVGSAGTNYVAIDLGWADSVRVGMNFDVFEIRGSGTKVRKGKIQVTKAHAHSSDCNILPPKNRNPICPQCQWEAYSVDMRYCVYCALGDSNDEIQQLEDKVVGVLVKPQDPFNPIIKGDKISNPFYYKGRKVRFSFAGEPVKRSRREIELFIQEQGGILDDDTSLETDYLVVGAGEHVQEALDKARRLGVKVMQEEELYQFFGTESVD